MLEFMHFGNTHEIIKKLDHVENSRGILPIFGEEATGKTRLINYWMHEYQIKERGITSEARPCLYVDLWKPQRQTIERSTYVTPITNALFSEMVYQMAEMPSIYSKEIMSSRWYQPTGTLSTDTQFLALFNFVRKYFKRQPFRLIIIDGAQLLDSCAIEMLLRLRKERMNQSGIILCIRLQKNEKLETACEDLRKRIPHAYHQDLKRSDRAYLQRLSSQQFAVEVLKPLFKSLHIRFPAAPSPEELAEQQLIGRRCWERTQGDWFSITELYDDFKTALTMSENGQQRLTVDVLRKVFGTW